MVFEYVYTSTVVCIWTCAPPSPNFYSLKIFQIKTQTHTTVLVYTYSKTIMMLAIPPEHRRQIAPATTPPPLSPMAPTKSIGSLPLGPTAGESSPTSILVD